MTVWTESFNGTPGNPPVDLTWSADVGSALTNGTRGYNSSASAAVWTTSETGAFADGYVQAEQHGATAARPSPAFRIVDASNYYQVVKSSTTNLRFRKRVGGTFTTLADYTITHTATDAIKLQMTGTAFEVFLAGVSQGTGTDAAHASGTPGVRSASTNASIDNWEAGKATPATRTYIETYRRTHMSGNWHR